MTEEKNSHIDLSTPTGRACPALAGDGLGRIFLTGFMGCGKTHWGKELSKALQIPFTDLDEKIEEQEGKTITEIFEQLGEEQFRIKEKEMLNLITESHEAFVMATGGGTPCFYNNIDYLKNKGTVIWFDCPVPVLKARLSGEKAKRPLVAGIRDEELEAFITRKLADRRIFYQQAHIILQNHITLPVLLEKIEQHKQI